MVSGDTGIAHLATAYRTPSVLLFGPTPPAWWGPLVDLDRHRVLWHGERFGLLPATGATHRTPTRRPPRTGLGRPHPALAAITVDEVLAAVEDVGACVHAPTPQ